MAVSTIDPNGLNVGQLGGTRNLLYNGAMQLSQRSSSETGITGSGYKTLDRWKIELASIGTWTMSQDASGPSGFPNSLKVLCTTAAPSLSSNEELKITQIIEGQNIQAPAYGTSDAKQMTVSFWVKSNKTGTYIVWLYQDDDGRQLTTSYTISSADTWEYKTIVIAADTTGIIDNDNGLGFRVSFVLGSGPSYTSGTAATSWEALVDANRYVGQTVNLADATSNYWQITGVQLEVGDTATDFQHENVGTTLQRCQRYCTVLNSPSGLFMYRDYYSTDTMVTNADLPVTMRTTPSITMTGSGGTSNTGFTYINLGAEPTLTALSPQAIAVYRGVASSARTYIHMASTGELTMEAEL